MIAALIIGIFVVVPLIGVIIWYIFHIGAGPNLIRLRNVLTSKARQALRAIDRFHIRDALPAIRRAKNWTPRVIWMIAFAAIVSLIRWDAPASTDWGMFALKAVIILAFSIAVTVQVLNTEPEGQNVRQQAVIPVGHDHVDVTYAAFAATPFVDVESYDPSQSDAFSISGLGPQGFRIELDAKARPHVFRYTATQGATTASGRVVIPVGHDHVDVTYGAPAAAVTFDASPQIEVAPFEKDDKHRVTHVTDAGFRIELPERVREQRFNYTVVQRPTGFPILNMVMVLVTAFAVQWATIFFAADGSPATVLVSIAPLMASLAMLFSLMSFTTWLATEAATAIEAGPNLGVQLLFRPLVAIAKKDWGSLDEIVKSVTDSSKQAISPFNQEQWEERDTRIKRMTVVALASIYLIHLTFASLLVTGFWIVASTAGLCGIIYLEYREYHLLSIIKSAHDNRQYVEPAWSFEVARYRYWLMALRRTSAGVMISILMLGIAKLFIATFFGDAWVNLIGVDITSVLTTTFALGHESLYKGLGSLAVVLLALGTLIAIAKWWPRGFTRMVAMLLAGLFVFAGLGGFAWALAKDRVRSTANSMATGLWQGFVPATAIDKQSVKVTWPEVPDATGYKLQRREIHEPTYKTLQDDKRDLEFAKGVTAYEDSTVQPEKTYFYRVIALGAGEGGADLVSDEHSVTTPKAPAPVASASASATPAAPSSVACATCGTSGGRSQFCTNHPNSPACK